MAYTFTQLEALWKQAGGNPVYAPMAAAVALAESGGDPTKQPKNSNGTIDRGLWQINSIHGSLSTTDPLKNARAAVEISNNGTNWRPWCSAWSNNMCGGTFLGKGAHVFAHLPAGADTGLTPTGTASSEPYTAAMKAIEAAYSEIGKPYQLDASTAGGLNAATFDCSSLIQSVYKSAGISLPRTAAEQQAATARISQSELRPGDLVFYGNPASHVMLYVGGGYVIEAPHTGTKVQLTKAWGGATNFGRVAGSGAQGIVDNLVSGVEGLFGGVGNAVSGVTGALDPQTWINDIWQTVFVPLAYVGEMLIGFILLIFSVWLMLHSTETGRKAEGKVKKWGEVGAVTAATGGAGAAAAPEIAGADAAAAGSETAAAETAATPKPAPTPSSTPRRRAQRRPPDKGDDWPPGTKHLDNKRKAVEAQNG